ncbi:MAG: LysR family transcriptional regulator [Burkholderiales bacterium]
MGVGVQGMAAFAETVRQGSFAAAARELGLSPSAVAKSVARLEEELGLRLLHRTTREVSLTSDGHGLFERCRDIVDAIDALRAQAEGVRGEPSGTLRINAPITWGKRVLVPILARLAAQYPKLALDVALSDRYVDLIQEGYDAAVRVGTLRDSSLVARPFGQQALVVVGSPAYLARQGRPANPAALPAHRCLVFRMPSTGRPRAWQFVVDGAPVATLPASTVTMNDGEAITVAATEGAGLAQVPMYMAEDALREGTLVEVLKAFRPPPLTIALVYPSNRQVPPRLRVLIEALTGEKAAGRGRARRR